MRQKTIGAAYFDVGMESSTQHLCKQMLGLNDTGTKPDKNHTQRLISMNS